MSPRNHSVPLAESQHHVINPTNPRGALDDGVEHRLHVRRRAADDAEHLGRCRLMLQRLAQFCVALLHFLEQSHVLDGDHGLVGEGFEKCDLLFGEGPNLRCGESEIAPMATPSRSNGVTRTVRVPVTCWRALASGNSVSSSGSNIMDVNRLAVDDGSASGRAATERPSALAAPASAHMLPHARSTSPSTRSIKASSRIAQPRSIFRHRIQHRLNVRRRAGDDAQDFTRRSLLLQRFLEFLEQPDVLDGDDRLVGEGFEQLDLRRGEGAHLGATCDQYSNEFPLLTKGNGQKGARARRRNPTLGNRSARGRRERGACHARASSETVVHQY